MNCNPRSSAFHGREAPDLKAQNSELKAQGSIRIHLLRHGRIASHRGDVPVTEEGLREVEAAASRFAEELEDGELVSILTTATVRSRDTALTLHRTMLEALDGSRAVEIQPPRDEPAIRNPDIFIGGLRVEMVSTGEAMAEQTASRGIGAEQAKNLPFYRDFFPSRDRVGYWVAHPDPPGENSEAVARRLMTWGISLLDLPRERPLRYIAVTHSPQLRAFLRYYVLGEDPGEPEFLESVDMIMPGDGSLVLRFRDRRRTADASSHSALRAESRELAVRD